MEYAITDQDLKIAADLVYKTCGIVFKDSNLSVLQSRLATKLKEKQAEAPAYLDSLAHNQQELVSFIDFVTTNFTSFFRNPKQFELLSESVLPEIVQRNADSKLVKLWSAACSSGEEPYTMSMVVHENFQSGGLAAKGWDYHITASDISLESLFVAKSGRFPAKSIQKIENRYANYFISSGEDVLIHEEIKKRVQFDFHNLIYDNGIRDMDVVFCRNVLIYFDENIQRKVLDNIALGMKPGAFLFIGHSESLIGIHDGFEPQNLGKGIVYVRK